MGKIMKKVSGKTRLANSLPKMSHFNITYLTTPPPPPQKKTDRVGWVRGTLGNFSVLAYFWQFLVIFKVFQSIVFPALFTIRTRFPYLRSL